MGDRIDDDQVAADDHVGDDEHHIAVVGMAGRYPEAPDLATFWENLRAGRDCLHTFTDEELDALDIPAEVYGLDNFVRRGTILPDFDRFDAGFFGYTPKQAGIMDPQARIFLETCYEALESAGYDPFDTGHSVGVFAGSNPNDYALLLGVADPTDSLSAFDQLIGVDRDFLTTRVAHNLGLTGPAMTVQTACSTSLVSVHAAVQSLLSYECSMALAGGVSINLRQGVGYFYQPGMILSPTGRCRAFDADAQGTTLGQGCGVVVLKRLAEARADGDHIVAVVRATATNNDGSDKISFTAPSENGQASVITTALALADIESDSVGYVEAHGTGTLLGDPIEVAALTRAFRPGTVRRGYCAIGSVKTNVGHTDAAAGVTGFIKAVLALHHREIPPTVHFETPNPEIDFANSPFRVNAELEPWPEGPTPRRACVSAFGIGGTNAHAVLEEAPPPDPAPGPDDRRRVVLLSAKTASAADRRVADLADALSAEGASTLAEVDHTLRRGRPELDHRRAVVVGPDRPLTATLAGETDGTVVRGEVIGPDLGDAAGDSPLVWLFAGQGAQYPTMSADLYRREPVFAEAVDRVSDHIRPVLGVDLRTVLFAEDPVDGSSAERLRQTSMAQPALFAVEHAMAALLRSWGVRPRAVIGHSIGEYAAAVEAGVLDWGDAATLVAHRGRLMQSMEPGSMVAVSLPAAELVGQLVDGTEMAADNSSALSVASGPTASIEALVERLEAQDVSVQLLHTSHAFHSAMMDGAVERFAELASEATFAPPRIPLLSNVTGKPLTDAEATDPSFWAGQIRRSVRFSDCLAEAARTGPAAFLEIGPGRALSTFVGAHEQLGADSLAVPTMRHPRQDRDDQVVLLEAMGRLWASGVEIDWDRVNGQPPARRVPLPTYPFERTEAWLPPHRHVLALPGFGPPSAERSEAVRRQPMDNWLHVPSWCRAPAPDRLPVEGTTVVLAPAGPLGDALVGELTSDGHDVVQVRPGDRFAQVGNCFTVDPDDEDWQGSVFAALDQAEVPVTSVVHAWLADPADPVEDLTDLERSLSRGVHAALDCARGLATFSRRYPVRLDLVTAEAFPVLGTETVRPEAGALLGPTRVVPLEYSGVTTRLIDLGLGLASAEDRSALVDELRRIAPDQPADAVVALRNGRRWVPTVAVRSTSARDGVPLLRRGGCYLVIGGLGGVGLSLSRFLAEHYEASLVLTGRSGRPTPSGPDDDETLRRLALLDEIEEKARSLEVVAVDATDEAAMAALVEQVEARSGPLNGVIVAAGVADNHGAIHRRSRADMTASMASKVQGSLILERALRGRELDFVVFSSSIAATLYHNRFAQVGYVTGNAFVEAFSFRGRQRGLRTFTVAWDDWLDIGMSVRAARDFSTGFGTDVDLVDRLNSFSPAEGVDLFGRALRTDEPVLLVSPTDLSARIEADVDVVSPFLQQATADEDVDELGGGTTTELVTTSWTSLLGYPSFEPTDDFFELGGDSLQAARLADRLSRALGFEVPVDVVFASSTLGALVEVLDEMAEREATAPPDENVLAHHGDEPMMLGPAQQRFLDRGTEHPEHFNVSVLLRPERPIDVDHLRTVVHKLVASHAALRLRLADPDSGGAVRQIVASDDEVDPVTVVDLADRSSEVEAIEALGHSAAEVQQSLDLHAGPVLRVVLYQLPEGGQRLLVVIHHLMADRVSLLLLLDALDADLQALAAGGEAGPRRSVTPFPAWVAAQIESVAARGPQLVEYWTDRPWDRVRSLFVDRADDPDGNRNDRAAVVELDIPAADLAAAVERTGARPDELVQLALGSVIGEMSDGGVALIDVLGHGRRMPLDIDVSRSVGMFMSYSPILVDAEAGLAQRLADLRRDLEQGWTFDALRLYGDDAVRATVADLPQPQVLVNYVGKAIDTDASAMLVPTEEFRGPEVDPGGRRDHLLAVRVDVGADGGLHLVFVYPTRFHDRSTIERLAAGTAELIHDVSSGVVPVKENDPP